MGRNICLNSKRTQAMGHKTAATSQQTTAIMDMARFDSVVFDFLIGTLSTGQALATFQAQGGNKSDGSDMANLVGALVTLADTSTAVGVSLEIFRPAYRYVQVVVTRTGQAPEILGCVATQYHDGKLPDGDDSTTWPQTVVAIEPQYSQTYYTTTTFTVKAGASGDTAGTSTGTTVVTTARNSS